MSTLLKNADILVRKEGKIVFLRNAYLGIDGAYIDYVSEDAPKKSYDSVKAMPGKLLIPGLVNAHTHTPMTLLRGVGSGLPLQRWLFEAIFPVEDKMDSSDVCIGTQMAILEMLACGTTCYQDMYWDYSEIAPMVLESGIKVNAGAVLQMNDPNAQWAKDFFDRRFAGTERFFKNFNNAGDGRIHANMQIHSEYLTVDESLERCAELAHRYGMEVHTHISETRLEHEGCLERHGETPLAHFERMGLLDTGAVCAHCVWVTDEDLEIMAEKGATFVHNPTSNLKLGSGIAPVAKAISKGVNVALGTDGTASNNNLNMFEEMHIASILQNGANCDPLAPGAQDAFDMATINGYKALHRNDCGELAEGKRADIVAIDMDKPHLLPDANTLALLVYSVQGSDVCMTMIDGKVLYENGEYTTIDAQKCKAEYLAAAKKLLG
ncbi:MAG: amidohydrolase [Firmicutes bacterium]|nr:amidohydrolase [Bacillota bacterium]